VPADPQALGDALRRQPVRHQLEDLRFPGREPLDPPPRLHVLGPLLLQELQDAPHLGGLEERFPPEGRADRIGNVSHRTLLGHEPGRSRVDRPGHAAVVLERRQHDHPRVGMDLLDLPGRGDAVQPRHLGVHENHVGFLLRRGAHGGLAVVDHADH
jgi:hypothetical protein